MILFCICAVIPFDQCSWLMAQVTCFRHIYVFSWVKLKIYIYISTIFAEKLKIPYSRIVEL